ASSIHSSSLSPVSAMSPAPSKIPLSGRDSVIVAAGLRFSFPIAPFSGIRSGPEEYFMAKEILIAGTLRGFTFFVWGGLAHAVLGLGMIGVDNFAQDQPVMDSLKASVPQPGFYFFPHVDKSGRVTGDRVGGPYGIMIYHTAGAGGSMSGQLI